MIIPAVGELGWLPRPKEDWRFEWQVWGCHCAGSTDRRWLQLLVCKSTATMMLPQDTTHSRLLLWTLPLCALTTDLSTLQKLAFNIEVILESLWLWIGGILLSWWRTTFAIALCWNRSRYFLNVNCIRPLWHKSPSKQNVRRSEICRKKSTRRLPVAVGY